MRSRKFIRFFYSSYAIRPNRRSKNTIRPNVANVGRPAGPWPALLNYHQLEEPGGVEVFPCDLAELFRGNGLDDPDALVEIAAVESVEQEILPPAGYMERSVEIAEDGPDREIPGLLQFFLVDELFAQEVHLLVDLF